MFLGIHYGSKRIVIMICPLYFCNGVMIRVWDIFLKQDILVSVKGYRATFQDCKALHRR
jgi:hypothetical protein